MNSMNKRFLRSDALRYGLAWALFLLTALALSPARAQNTDWPNEYAKRVRATENVSPLSDEAFGDKVNLFNGTVRFSHDLISLPGNSALPVSLGIFLDPHDITGGPLNGNWDLDIPYVGAVHHSKSAEAKGWVAFPSYVNNGYVDFDYSMFWSGNRLTINGGGGGDLLKIGNDPKQVKPNNSVSYTFATKDGWYFSELPSVQNGPGKGLIGYAPDGTKYTFDWLVYRRYSSITHPWGYNVANALLHRYKLKLYVSKIEDRFGNWVKYEWEQDHPKRIYANDGREITMTYTDPAPYLFAGNVQTNILSATANGRTWTFSYPSGEGGNVRNPDGTEWKYEGPGQLGTFRLDVAEYLLNPDTNQTYPKQNVPCSPGAILKDTTSRARITHPSGAVAQYTFKSMRHGRTNVPFLCETGINDNSPRNRYSTFHDTWSITEKRISAPGVAEKAYTYSYDGVGEGYQTQDESRWDIGAGWNAKYAPPAPNYKTVTVTEPDGTQNIHTFGRDRDINEGQLFKVETKKAGTAYRVVDSAYVTDAEAAAMPFPNWMGSNGDEYADKLPNSNRPLKSAITRQDGATFNRAINAFDALARPVNTTAWSSGTASDGSRTTTTEYHDDLALWVLGQVKKENNANTGWIVSRTEYDAQARPSQRYAFGRLVESYGYNADGTLATVTDGGGNVTALSAWKRGLPQSIQYADLTGDSAVVDDNGWLSSVTDENGYTTAYAYDPMGRLKTVTPPSGDSNAWSATQITLSRRDMDEYGLPPGHWMHTTTIGGRYCKNVFLDGFWRPVLTHEWDCADLQGTLRASAQRYDDKGRTVFSSYPLGYADAFPNVFSTPLKGTYTDYDALGRVSLLQQDSELGRLSARTEYLSGFQTRLTNPRQQQTTTAYQTFDQPGIDAPVSIAHPEGTLTTIARDILGAATAIRRSNQDGTVQLTRSYVYDGQHRLCKSIEPETGATATGYDAANNIAWTATGLALPATDSCNRDEALASGRAIGRSYDARNRIKALSFPDGRGNQAWTYYPDGLPKEIVTQNGGQDPAVTNRYWYNKLRLPTAEQMSFSTFEWGFGLDYTNEGKLASHTYPNGQQVAYDTNGLGQAKRAGSYASEVSYFANGGLARFVYGNGIVHTLTQNARGLAERSRDAGAATVLDDSYDYDANGNVAAISDGRAGAPGNRSMTYDGLDRLTTTASTMFGAASYSYDALDNLRTVKVAGTATVPGRQHVYYYNGANQLELVRTPDGAGVIGLEYDEQGNLRNKNGKQFRFDYGNRLREAKDAESYLYDGHGRRVLSTSPTLGRIVSMYSQDGVLRYQRDFRKEKDIAYFHLNGSLVAKATSPTAPDVPVVAAPSYVSQTSYTVSWSNVTASGSYELQERTNGGAWQALYNGAERSRTLSGRSSGSYGYRVRACNGAGGCGLWSVEANVQVQRPPTEAPVLTVPATALNGQYSVSWAAAGGATDYVLEESFKSGAWSTAYSGSALSQAFSAKPYGVFAYRVKACNPAGCGPTSAASNVSVLYPPGSAPTLTAPAQSDAGSFAVSWTAVGGTSRYELEQNALGGGWALIQDANATSRTIVGGASGTYGYRVRACNAAGCGATSAEVQVTVIGPPTAVPSMSLAASNNTGSFEVTWTVVPTATAYQLEGSREGAAWQLLYQAAANGTILGGLGDGRYGYRVRGCNPAGCGPYSDVRFIVVDLPPATPSITLADWLRNTLKGSVVNDTCTVRWTTTAKTQNYELQSADNGAQLYRGSATQAVSASSGQYCALNYAVRACGTGGCSAWSSPAYPATRRTEPMD
ncbi:RHS repeat protein [Lysobacter enzymogenes]|uniref:RHS repeat protein n=1 Tax=Lysobacter enzymogenes TaxID=69 RepID=UPI001A966ECB|nr:RHS repeat protein [Lysobacter enzymogenes]QQP94770.1 RHS repeat protein [Lysobacter enzymogenes]